MCDLTAFLHPAAAVEPKEVFISRRFTGKDGKPVPFVIRPLTQEENEQLIRQSTRGARHGEAQLDKIEYGRRLIVAATVTPDFKSQELCAACKTRNPLEVPGKLLLAGEFQRLTQAILALSGLDSSQEELEEQAKN